jgi:tryptophanyl-tRNA synthetase
MMRRVFSGIQPTGVPHLGNYLGAFRHWVALQEDHDAFYCIVDLHAMTLPWDPAALRRGTLEVAASLLACGIDPARSVVFVQSDVPAHAELAWILECIARMGELRRMVQFRERSRGETETVGVGVFTYPVLQAADVLAYRANGVPVGEDQRQHVELMRDLAGRFNATYGEVFVLPEAWIPAAGARIMSLDDPAQKMSKSAGRPASNVTLTESPEAIARKFRSAVTDSGREVRAGHDKPALTNLLTIYSLVTGEPVPALEQEWAGRGYGDFKAALAAAVADHFAPIRSRYEEAMADPGELEGILARGAEQASAIAGATMASVREAAGLLPARAAIAPAPPEAPKTAPAGGPRLTSSLHSARCVDKSTGRR